ncbi:Conserved_hypothetical protein [Hexamita inflata]|uniref:ISXO2-like transposase domain-containing protein n=1 Tax=Hexamita inflata TaxID=28002 RepID=A0AA86U328_9EUKA|nr:Conserved hypothetical protein [Hexamita inflata]
MEAFKPTLLDNISFYAKFKKFDRAPPLPKQCTKCFHPVKLVGNIFICINTNCKKRHDLWAGTPLAGFHSMQWDRHFQLIVECASNSTAASAAAKYFVNERTVDRVFDQFREYCQKYLERIQFYDGEDKEIDEFVGARVKYHRGEPTKGTTKWFFSIRGRQSRIFRCFYILGRSIEEVQPLINKYCKIGDTVYSDGLATYKHLSSTFVHKSVNHSEHFADPEDPTNNINGLEGSHGALRKKLAFMVQFKQIKSNSTSISIAFRDNLVMIPYNSWIMCGLHLMNENKKYYYYYSVLITFQFQFKNPKSNHTYLSVSQNKPFQLQLFYDFYIESIEYAYNTYQKYKQSIVFLNFYQILTQLIFKIIFLPKNIYFGNLWKFIGLDQIFSFFMKQFLSKVIITRAVKEVCSKNY